MRFRSAMTLGTALLFATAVAFGASWTAEPWPRTPASACTPEAYKCLEKLEASLRLHGHGRAAVEQALLRLEETDPVCALLLRGVTLSGL